MSKKYEVLEKHTTVFHDDKIIAQPVGWIAGRPLLIIGMLNNLRIVESEDVDDLRNCIGFCYTAETGTTITQKDLPREFFIHELVDANCNKFEEVFNFIKNWGFPYSIYRAISIYDQKYLSSKSGYAYAEHEQAIQETNKITQELKNKSSGYWGDDAPKTVQKVFRCISLDETIESILLLQYISRSITDAVASDKDTSPQVFELLNMATCNPHIARPKVTYDNKSLGSDTYTHKPDDETQTQYADDFFNQPGTNLQAQGYLTSAICNQIVDTIKAPAPWRLCANEKCNRIFKYQQSKAKSPHEDSWFCSVKCANNQRAAKREQDKTKAKTTHPARKPRKNSI